MSAMLPAPLPSSATAISRRSPCAMLRLSCPLAPVAVNETGQVPAVRGASARSPFVPVEPDGPSVIATWTPLRLVPGAGTAIAFTSFTAGLSTYTTVVSPYSASGGLVGPSPPQAKAVDRSIATENLVNLEPLMSLLQ